MKKISKIEVEREIKEFFEDIKNKSPREIEKIKKLAMSRNIQLKELKKKFCKRCYFPLKGKTRINKGIKSITCENCNYINRWKINN